jgi:predicted ester cyclase
MTDVDLSAFYRHYLQVLNSHEFERMDEFVHDEIVLNGMPAQRADMIEILKGIVVAVPDFNWRLEELIVDVDRVGARLINSGTLAREWLGAARSGASFEIVEFAIYQVRDGRFVHLTALHDAEALHLQLGGEGTS